MANKALKVNPSLSLVAQSIAPSDPAVNEIYNDSTLGLLRWAGSAWVALSSGGGGGGAAWAGYHDSAAYWQTASNSYVDPSAVGSPNLVESINLGFGSVTTAASSLPGITFTPVSGAIYSFNVTFVGYIGTGGQTVNFKLTDGTTDVGWSSFVFASTAGGLMLPISGLYTAASGAPVTIKIQVATSGGTAMIEYTVLSPAINWVVTRIS